MAALRDETRDLAKSYGLDIYEVIFDRDDHDELNMVASHGGFPMRYPHWRFVCFAPSPRYQRPGDGGSDGSCCRVTPRN